jgi:multiple sugar transport system ATP-binding protein
VFDDGGLKLRLADGQVLPIPASSFARYAACSGHAMTLGLRPEHLTEQREGARAGVATLNALIDVVEPMGMETLIHFFLDSQPVCARVDPATVAHHGETLPLAADLNQMHLIDNDTGRVV